MNHKELVKKAVFWLSMAKGCNPIFAEKTCVKISEIPDAIGWAGTDSIVIECKTSRSDLLADKSKPHRFVNGLGNKRYYLMTKDIYSKCSDYDWNGWGVITCDDISSPRQVRNMDSKEFESSIKNERDFLRSRILEIQRFGTQYQ